MYFELYLPHVINNEMPELPEVQTTVSGLQKVLPGLKIANIWTDLAVKKPSLRYFDQTLKNLAYFNKFKKIVEGQKIKKVERLAKNILIFLTNGPVILIHLKMTGNLLYGEYLPKQKYIHVIFNLSNDKQLALRDLRKFGKVTLLNEPVENSIHLKDLGPEPLEKTFTLTRFKNRLQTRPNSKIKSVLMDPKVIAGIGNIYSDEILWATGIHPEQKIKLIPEEKLKLIFKFIKKILKEGVKLGGDSTSDYRNIYDQKGNFQNTHKAYRLTGKPCAKKDGGAIIRIKVGGRSAHYCPKHQKLLN